MELLSVLQKMADEDGKIKASFVIRPSKVRRIIRTINGYLFHITSSSHPPAGSPSGWHLLNLPVKGFSLTGSIGGIRRLGMP